MSRRSKPQDHFPPYWARLLELLQVPIKAIVWLLLLPFWAVMVFYEWWQDNWKS